MQSTISAFVARWMRRSATSASLLIIVVAPIAVPNDILAEESHAHHHHVHRELEAGEHSSESLFQVDSTWLDQQGKTRRLADFAGAPTVLAMVYASCDAACPAMIALMKHMESSADVPKNTQFVLVSFDPERDTVDKLQAFARSLRLSDRWTLLRGAPDDVRELAVLLGVRFKQNEDKSFSHSNNITVLDGSGEIEGRSAGLGTSPSVLVELAREAAS